MTLDGGASRPVADSVPQASIRPVPASAVGVQMTARYVARPSGEVPDTRRQRGAAAAGSVARWKRRPVTLVGTSRSRCGFDPACQVIDGSRKASSTS